MGKDHRMTQRFKAIITITCKPSISMIALPGFCGTMKVWPSPDNSSPTIERVFSWKYPTNFETILGWFCALGCFQALSPQKMLRLKKWLIDEKWEGTSNTVGICIYWTGQDILKIIGIMLEPWDGRYRICSSNYCLKISQLVVAICWTLLHCYAVTQQVNHVKMMGIPFVSLTKVNVLSCWHNLRCLDFGSKHLLWLWICLKW